MGGASNPDHLRNVRMYLGVIEVDPLLARPLLAALVVHLKLGGLLVTDTDLFQRDISSLLSRPVGPVYLHVKQLLKLVPAYFNEIGAEGALREASSQLDELEGRRDPPATSCANRAMWSATLGWSPSWRRSSASTGPGIRTPFVGTSPGARRASAGGRRCPPAPPRGAGAARA